MHWQVELVKEVVLLVLLGLPCAFAVSCTWAEWLWRLGGYHLEWLGWLGHLSLIIQQASLDLDTQWTPKNKNRSCKVPWGLVSEFTQGHFLYILRAKASHLATANSKGEEIDSTSWWEELQNIVAIFFQSTNAFWLSRECRSWNKRWIARVRWPKKDNKLNARTKLQEASSMVHGLALHLPWKSRSSTLSVPQNWFYQFKMTK